MKISELIEELNAMAAVGERTADTVKCGNPDAEIEKIAVTMFATPRVIKAAAGWGANFIISHEPTFYADVDIPRDNPVDIAKNKLLKETGIVIYRYHDHMHKHTPDLITRGVLSELGLEGEFVPSGYYASAVFTPSAPISADELCALSKERLGAKHIRVAGNGSFKGKKIAACFGTPAGVFELLCDDGIDIVMVGESCEWRQCEYARDAAELGINKAMVVMGHEPSERLGMHYLAKMIRELHSTLEIKCFDSGEVYN